MTVKTWIASLLIAIVSLNVVSIGDELVQGGNDLAHHFSGAHATHEEIFFEVASSHDDHCDQTEHGHSHACHAGHCAFLCVDHTVLNPLLEDQGHAGFSPIAYLDIFLPALKRPPRTLAFS